jgi:hypothetical protein
MISVFGSFILLILNYERFDKLWTILWAFPCYMGMQSKPNKKSGLRGAYNVDSEKVPAEQPEHHQEGNRGQFDPS